MPQPILIVMHQETSTPGRVGHALRARGFPLDMRRPRFGDPLPGDHGRACRRHHLRRPDERQRHRRFRPPRDRLAGGAAAGEEAVSRHLPRRPDAGAVISAAGCSGIPTAMPRSATTRSGRPRSDARSAIPGPSRSTSGTGKASTCRSAPSCWRRATSFPVQAFRYGGRAYALQFHPDVTHAMMCRWTTRGHERMADAQRQAARSRISPTARSTIRPAAPGSRRSSTIGWRNQDGRRSKRPPADAAALGGKRAADAAYSDTTT